MDVLARILGADLMAGTPSPTDDFWYGPVGTMTSAGIKIDADGAKKISAWFRGREILATALAMLPLQLYQRLPDDAGAEPARSHPLYDVLHRKPDPTGSGDTFTWRRQGMYDLIDHGWCYDRIDIAGDWSLRRIDPRMVTPELLTKGPYAGRYLFHLRNETGTTTTLTQDEVFYRMASDGKGILEYARDSLGLARVTETFAGKVFGDGSLNAGLIEVPGPMNTESSVALAKSFKTAVGDWHMPRILPQGAKFVKDDGLTPDKAQMLLSRKFSINDIARWLGLPPHMLGDLDRATFSNIEHQGQEFVTYSLGPWLSLWEFAINDQLILQPNKFFAEFTRDALVRGDIAARWAAYQIAVSTGTFTRNEIRRKENANKLPGLDTPLDPAFLSGKQPAGANGAKPKPPMEPDEDDDAADEARMQRAELIASRAAARLLRKEITAAQKAAVKYAASDDDFAAWVTEFYTAHVALVSDTLGLSAEAAHDYCTTQAAQLLNVGLRALETWRTDDYAAGLAALALEECAA